MGKAKNRNAQRIANGQQPKPNVSGKSHKPFIGNAVFTMEDDRIMRDIIAKYPDTWTLAQIKDALPYSHTFKNITNYLQRLVSADVIAQHASISTETAIEETPQTPSAEDYFVAPESYNVQTVLEVLQKYFPQLGEKYEEWPALIKSKTGRKMTRSQIIRTARQAQLAYTPADWTQAENDLLLSETDAFVSVHHEPTYIHDIFDFPRTHEQVLEQIINLNNLSKMVKTSTEEAHQTKEQLSINESPSLPDPKPVTIESTPEQERKVPAMANTNTKTAPAQNAEQKNKDDFIALSNILMNLTPDTEVHVNIKFANGLVVNFEKGAANA